MVSWRSRGLKPWAEGFAAKSASRDIENNCQSCHDFGSAHQASWNVAMADGSVRSLSHSMDIYLHRALASISGEEVASAAGGY